MQRIAVTVTAHEDSYQRSDVIPETIRPAWMTASGLLFYRDVPEGTPAGSGFRMIPPPARERQEWRRASGNHGTVLAMQGGRGYTIRREPGADWQDVSAA